MSVDNVDMDVLPAFLEKFPSWKNFPTGLHILVVDEDALALHHSQTQLEACHYTVTPFSDRHAAVEALHQQREAFHLVIVEINLKNAAEVLNIVRAAKHLPTILLCAAKNVNLMMEGIAAGASEFLEKPLSKDKAKNLWQHVFRKALATGELIVPTHDNDNCITGKEPCSKGQQEESHIGEEQADPFSNVDDDLHIIGDECNQLLFNKGMYENDQTDRQEVESQSDVKACASYGLMEDFVSSSGPSTPQLEQSETRVVNVSDDESPHSQEFSGMNAGPEDVNSSDDCSSFVQAAKSEMDDMDGLFLSASEGDEFQSLYEFQCLDTPLNEGKDLNVRDTLHFYGSLTLADELVDELSSCLDMDSSILDELPSADSLQMSLNSFNDEDQQDEEALLLAEVAKAEAGMTRLSDTDTYMLVAPSIPGDISGWEEKSSQDQLSRGRESSAHSKKKMKVDWTPELHRRFVHAVEHLGVDKAIPSRILEMMGAQHLTRHNIASHLQKYRSHKKHMQAREVVAATWNQRRQMGAVRQPSQPQVVSRPAPLVPMGLHVWGHPTPEQYWSKPWQASDVGSLWHQPPPVCMDAWGHSSTPGTPFFYPSQFPAPVARLPLASIPGVINGVVPVLMPAEKRMHPPKEMVNAAISEVLKNPFTPLPLGLKPPLLDVVLSELQRQGVKAVPPTVF